MYRKKKKKVSNTVTTKSFNIEFVYKVAQDNESMSMHTTCTCMHAEQTSHQQLKSFNSKTIQKHKEESFVWLTIPSILTCQETRRRD